MEYIATMKKGFLVGSIRRSDGAGGSSDLSAPIERRLRDIFDGGYSLLEVLIAMVVFSVALLSLSSISLSVLGGNKSSRDHFEGALMAQETIETLRSLDFDLGKDMAIGGGDDNIAAEIVNCSTANDNVTDPSLLFESPDYAFEYTNDVENTGSLLTCPGSVTVGLTPRRTWSIKDDSPVTGMKTLSVVVGWSEKGTAKYYEVSTAIMGR